MRTIALYNRQGQRILTLKQAEHKGYGSVWTLKQRIRRTLLAASKAGPLWLVREIDLSRPTGPRSRRQK